MLRCIELSEWDIGQFVAQCARAELMFSALNYFLITRLPKKNQGVKNLDGLIIMCTSIYSKITTEVKTLRRKLMSEGGKCLL